MSRQQQHKEFGAFLRHRREQTTPAIVGVKSCSGRRRRTPGLRREEAADLIGISPIWYTRLEQGHDVRPSPQVLENIARVFGLTYAEKKYMFSLANASVSPVKPDNASQSDGVAALQRVLNHQGANPAYAMDRRWNLIGWNRAATTILFDFGMATVLEQNLLYLMFTESEMRKRIVDWEVHAMLALSAFRSDYAENIDDPFYTELIELLCLLSEEFCVWWGNHATSVATLRTQEIEHPWVGRLRLEQTTFQLVDAPHLKLILYAPLDRTTECSLNDLQDRLTLDKAKNRLALGNRADSTAGRLS